MINIKNITLARWIGILLVLAAVGGGTAYAGSVVSRDNNIDRGAAETFTIVDAGVDKKEVTSLHTHMERDRGKYVYDVEFHVGDVEYEYEVLAEDGTILNKNVDGQITVSEDAGEPVKTASGHSGQETKGIDGRTGQNQDGEGSKTGVGQDDEDIKDSSAASLDGDGGREDSGPIHNGAESKEDSADGQDDSFSAQDTSVTGQTSPPIDFIGVDRAKQIALDHAGFRENEVIFSKAKFDKEKDDEDDDGPEYEIEFYNNKMEYEYEIDALTGKNKEYSAEPDD